MLRKILFVFDTPTIQFRDFSIFVEQIFAHITLGFANFMTFFLFVFVNTFGLSF